MTRAKRRQPVAYAIGRHSAWLSGNNSAVYQALEGSGVRNMFDRSRGCPTIPVQSLDEVLARLDVAGVPVELGGLA